ncbi:MAG: fructosamine kinase family protein [Candidatus Promineifilaceae bacterium]
MDLRQQIEQSAGLSISSIAPLSGGSVGQVYCLQTTDDRSLVAKVDNGPRPRLDVEGYMLDYLSAFTNLPVPATVYASPQLLVMTHLPGNSSFSSSAQKHAAELLAGLHGLTSPSYGLERDTLIGGLHQPNRYDDKWIPFFAEQRLLYMAGEAAAAGRLPSHMIPRIEKMAARLPDYLVEPDAPSLIHGDIWTTNVLASGGRITAFLDPAIYFASPEIELAFITLFGSFGEPFFSRYQELRPIVPGFFNERRDIYNLYPLLVHVRLFGGGYVSRVDAILNRFGL